MRSKVVDRSDHPGFFVSSWPIDYGHATLHGKERYRHPHLNLNSVLVVVLSNEYTENAWWRLQNMLRYTENAGYTVAFEEMDDMSTMPADAIGIMRACATMLALDSGFEWCFMVDTDVLVEEDTLIKLLDRDTPVVFPLLDILYDENPGLVASQAFRPNTGMHTVYWSAMSCMLFNTKVFNCLDHYAWHGHDSHFSQSLAHYGHRIHVDTDTIVKVNHGPSRHPSKTWNNLWDRLKLNYDKRLTESRDRRPPPDFDPAFTEGIVDDDGVYWAKENWARGGALGPYRDLFLERNGHESS